MKSANRADKWEITEDHAFNIIKHRGTDWVVDAYYLGFNGYRLKDLFSEQGITKNSEHTFFAYPSKDTRRIIRYNKYPKIYNPKPTRLSCTSVFQG
jgi:hypothetical protein